MPTPDKLDQINQLTQPKSYDSTQDILEHKQRVTKFIGAFALELLQRARDHDNSKLREPEKAVFDEYTWRLKNTEFGSEQYKAHLAGMADGLKHHYAANRHHPEHWDNGIAGMTLTDLVEMFCDWLAAAEGQGKPVDLAYLFERFHIDEQLRAIFANTLATPDPRAK